MQLTRVKSRERRRDFNFALEGEVVSRCKNIGKKVAETGSAPKVGRKSQATYDAPLAQGQQPPSKGKS